MTQPELFLRITVIGGDRLDNDYDVFFEGRRVGRIREATERTGFNSGWAWSINPPLPVPPWGSCLAPSLDEAKVEFKEAWARFYVGLTPQDIAYWHHHQDAVAERLHKK